MFRLLVSSRYRRVRKMQPHWFYLLYLFIYTIFKEDNSPVICIHGPHLRGKPWNSPGKVLDNYFLIVPAVPGKCGGYNIGTLTLLGFSVLYGGARSRVVTISLSPQGGAYTSALESENHYPRPSPYVGEQWIQKTGA